VRMDAAKWPTLAGGGMHVAKAKLVAVKTSRNDTKRCTHEGERTPRTSAGGGIANVCRQISVSQSVSSITHRNMRHTQRRALHCSSDDERLTSCELEESGLPSPPQGHRECYGKHRGAPYLLPGRVSRGLQ